MADRTTNKQGGTTVMNTKLFPPYLNLGSSGAAVDALHILLHAMGYGEGIVRDGDYGEATAAAVKKLQEDLGFPEAERDGNFGPATRSALSQINGINVDEIPAPEYDFDTFDADETEWIGSDGEKQTWPPNDDEQ